MTQHHDGGGRGLHVLHLNLRHSFLSLQIVTDYARLHNIDVLLLQDIPSSLMTPEDSFNGFQKFLSVGPGDSLTTAVLVARGLSAWNLSLSSS